MNDYVDKEPISDVPVTNAFSNVGPMREPESKLVKAVEDYAAASYHDVWAHGFWTGIIVSAVVVALFVVLINM